MSTVDRSEVMGTFEALSHAWREGNGALFSESCTPDVDFINLLGMYVKGRSEVAELHDRIFKGPYANTTVTFSIETMQTLGDGSVLVIAPSVVDISAGPLEGTVSTIATVVLSRDGERWLVRHFHNTRREATQAGGHFDALKKTLDA